MSRKCPKQHLRLAALLTLMMLAICPQAFADPEGQLSKHSPGLSLRLSNDFEAPWAKPNVRTVAQHGIALKKDSDVGDSLIRELVLYKGESLIGTQYIYGANRADAVDCSSLVQQMFRSAGIHVPRTTREQIRIGEPVEMDELKPGDLLFYAFGTSGLHVAVYIEDGEVLHASTTRRKVIRSKLNSAWHRKLVTARRRL